MQVPIESALAAVVERTDLRIVRAFDEWCECVYDAKWPTHSLVIAAPTAELQALLDAAAGDVEDLWPGRDPVDGAIALVAVGLQSVLDAREKPAEQVRLASLRWVVEPSDPRPSGASPPGAELEWRAGGS